jgi:hypothetical protein
VLLYHRIVIVLIAWSRRLPLLAPSISLSLSLSNPLLDLFKYEVVEGYVKGEEKEEWGTRSSSVGIK